MRSQPGPFDPHPSHVIVATSAASVVLWCIVVVAVIWLAHVGLWAVATLAEFAGWLP